MRELFSGNLVLSYEAHTIRLGDQKGGESYEEKKVLSIDFKYGYDNVAFWMRRKRGSKRRL